MARKGQPVPIERCLPPETLGRVGGAASRRARSRRPPEPEESAGLWALFLACRGDGP